MIVKVNELIEIVIAQVLGIAHYVRDLHIPLVQLNVILLIDSRVYIDQLCEACTL